MSLQTTPRILEVDEQPNVVIDRLVTNLLCDTKLSIPLPILTSFTAGLIDGYLKNAPVSNIQFHDEILEWMCV